MDNLLACVRIVDLNNRGVATRLQFGLRVSSVVVAQGATEIGRHGIPVFAGMIAATAVGLFVIGALSGRAAEHG